MSDQGDYASVRAIEMRLFEEVGNQLKALTTAVQGLTAEVRDVRDRLIRVETQNSPEKMQAIEESIRQLFERSNQSERDRADSVAKLTKEHTDYKLTIEKRLVRVEMFVAPLSVLGGAIVAAVVAHFLH